jgi:cell pole-organizing protein PopZ
MSDAKGQHEPSMEEILASIRRIIAEDGDAAPAAEQAAPVAAVASAAAVRPPEPPIDEILELTEVVEDDGSVVPFGSRAAPEAPPPSPSAAFDFDDEPPPPPPLRGDVSDRLVSDATAAASVAALSHLVARGQREELPMGPNRTLEDIVRELIRPMLKEWLDDKLPYIVERIVKDEVTRLVRDAQGH